jgi:hypothetical protein
MADESELGWQRLRDLGKPPFNIRPDAIFLDSTALFTLGSSFTNVDFEFLRHLRGHLNCRLCTSVVNWKEYLRHRGDEVLAPIDQINRVTRDLTKFGLDPAGLRSTESQLKGYLSNLEGLYENRARTIGLEITPLPRKLTLQRLFSMAMECLPPFERKNEKGFRDALAIFSFLEYSQEQKMKKLLVITDDKLSCLAVKALASEHGTEAEVAGTILEACSVIAWEARSREQRRFRDDFFLGKDILENARNWPLVEEAIRSFPHEKLRWAIALQTGTDVLIESITAKNVPGVSLTDKVANHLTVLFRIVCEAHVRLNLRTDTTGELKTVVVSFYGRALAKDNAIQSISIDEDAGTIKVTYPEGIAARGGIQTTPPGVEEKTPPGG